MATPALNLILRGSLDQDAVAYCARSGATERRLLSDFAKELKRDGIWDKFICWPLLPGQNAGSGSMAYSFGGLGAYDGTLINGPTWGNSGITFVKTSTQYIQTTWSGVAGITPERTIGVVVVSVAGNGTTAFYGTVALGKAYGLSAQFTTAFGYRYADDLATTPRPAGVLQTSIQRTGGNLDTQYFAGVPSGTKAVTTQDTGSAIPFRIGGRTGDEFTGVLGFAYGSTAAINIPSLNALLQNTLFLGRGLL